MEYEVLLINIFRDTSGYSESFNDSIGQYLIAAYLRERDFVAQVYSGNILDCMKTIENEVLNHHVHIIGFMLQQTIFALYLTQLDGLKNIIQK